MEWLERIKEGFALLPWGWQWGIVALIGACFGSFVTLASYRLPRDEPVICLPSRCTGCGKTLKPWQLVPVFSWIVQCGRCGFCKAPVSWRYPAVELATAVWFVAVFALHGVSLAALLLMLLGVGLLVMIVADFEHTIIPDEVHLVLIPLGLCFRYFIEVASPLEIAGGVALGLGLGLALRYGYFWCRGREGLGMGDVKFLATAGAWLPFMTWPPFVFFAGLIGILTALLWRALGKGALFPFGPALAFSLAICVSVSVSVEWFWSLFLALRN